MVENVIRALIVLAVAVGLVFLILWVLAQIGLALPAIVVNVIWVVVVLAVLLYLWRTFGGSARTGL